MGKNSKKQFRRNERTYRGHQNLDKFLSDKKLQRKQIAKDGSCLFRAVAEQVFSSQSHHQKVRMQCVEYIQAHQDDFKEFITTSMPEYLDQLKNELWGGELELVVLSRLYERSIIIYNEANGVVHEQVFQASEDQASSQQYSPIMLAFSGGNHYDSVYSTQHMRNTAFCQGIVYETLFLRVLKDTMPSLCKQRLASLQDSDMEQIRMHKEAPHYDRPFIERPSHLLATHYMVEEIESMAANLYRNTAMDVHQREKASIERRDRRVAASIQFQRGDAIIFKIGDKEMEGEIANLYVSPGCHLVYMHKSGETWEIPAKDIALKQSHLNSGRRSTSGQYRSRNQQQQQFGGQTSGQKGQQSTQSDSSKATDTPTLTKETPSSKKSGAQGGKSKDGKKSSTAQQGSQNPSSKGVPAGAIPLHGEKSATTTTQPHTLGSAPPPHTPTSDQKQTAASSSSISPPGGTGAESSTAATTGQRRVALSLSRNIQHTQVRSGHSVKATSHSAKVTKRTDAGSLDSDDPSSTSDDESSPHSEHHHPHSRRRPHHQARRANSTNDSLPAYYDEDDWSTGEQENVALQKQQAHIGGKERKTIPVVEGKLHVGRGGLGYSDTSIKQQQQQVRATQKAVSGQTMKSGGGSSGTTTKVSEVKMATSSQSSDPSKLGSRQTGTTAPMTKGEPTRTSPARKQSQQQSTQQSKVVMQVPAPAGLLQQQSPIQGLIDGPNSERDGRESPPYLDRLIPRDPSSQPQDAWPLFEEDPATHTTANLPPSVEVMMLNITSRQQHRAPPPSSPPAVSGIVLPPPASTITTTHNGNPPLPEQGTGIIPVVPPLAHAHAQQQPTPPQSPIPDQLQTGGAGQPPPLPAVFPPTVPISPPSSTTAAMPTMFHSLMQPGHFVPPMTTAAAVQQFFAVSGQDMLYNQAHHTHSSVVPPPAPPELANGGGNGNGNGDSSSMAGIPPSLVSPLQPLSIKKSSPRRERTTAAMSPLTVTAYTQTFFPKLTNTHVQTEVKQFREQGTQFNLRMKEARAQTDGQFVAATELSPPELEDDSKVAKVNFAIEYSIKCLNVYLQYVDDDETSSELLQMLENLKEQRLEEQAMPYESQLTALNASQQDFLVSLARDRSPRFPINAHPVGEGPTGMSIYQPKLMKEAMPPQAGEDVTLQQAATSLPGIVKPPPGIPPDASLTSSSSTSDVPPLAPDDDKSSDINVDVTPQQEIQPPTAAPPYPVPPHLMMHPQRYMMPMPMFYGPGFYPHSFPGMPGLPGMPGMMMPPYGPHMIPPVPQQQQPPPPATGQLEQNLESLEEASSTTSTSMTKLSPPLPPPSAVIPNQSPPPTSVDHQSVPMVDSVQALHVTAFQAEDIIPEDAESVPLPAMSPTVENGGEGGIIPQPTDSISTMLEEHQQVQQEDDGQQLGSVAFIPSTTTTTTEAYVTTDTVQHPIEQQVGDYQMQSEEKAPSTVDSDVNISNPGLPCRGSSGGSAKETEAVSSVAGEDKENEQKADTKQQKPKSSRTKQQQQQQQQMPQENTSSKQQSRANSTSYPRQQQNYQRMGATGMYNRGRYYNNYGNQRQQQYNPNRRYNNYQSNGGRMYNARYNAGGGGGGGNSGRYQQKWTPYQGGQQHGGGSSYSSSSEQGMNRPHNPSRSKVHTSSSGSSDHNSKSVTPVPATNVSASTEDHDRNVPQFNNSNNNYLSSGAGKFSPKSFTSFPSSPQNHHSSINGEIAMSSNMVVPQTATDSAPMTTSKEGEKKVHRWHFKETVSDRQRLEVPDPNLWNWTSSSGDRQFGYRQQGDYTETVEDPFPTMTVGGDDKEFAFRDACMDDFDPRQVEELFPALKCGRYDPTGIHHPPAQCTNRSNA